MGLNLLVVQGVRGSGNISELMIASLPFVAVIAMMGVVLILLPDLALIFTQHVR